MTQRKQNLQTQFDIQLIYSKGKKALIMDKHRNRNIINLLKHACKLVDQLQSIPNKNGQIYSKYNYRFKNLKVKVLKELEIIGEQGKDMSQSFKKVLNQIIDELTSKARRYQEGEQRVKQISKMRVQTQQQAEQQDERIKEQMLQLMLTFKNHATEMGKDLQRDSNVLTYINKKQDNVLSELNRQNKSMKQIENNSLGFFTLMGYSAIAAFLWIFTLVFIIVF